MHDTHFCIEFIDVFQVSGLFIEFHDFVISILSFLIVKFAYFKAPIESANAIAADIQDVYTIWTQFGLLFWVRCFELIKLEQTNVFTTSDCSVELKK